MPGDKTRYPEPQNARYGPFGWSCSLSAARRAADIRYRAASTKTPAKRAFAGPKGTQHGAGRVLRGVLFAGPWVGKNL
jgi:hypothetical protein